jgi:hypothetical protein
MTQRQTKKANLPADPLRARTKPTKGDLVTGFELPALSVVQSYTRTTVSPEEIVTSLRDHAKQVNEGDMTLVESMLLSQAIALQNMFSDLATRAAGQSTMQGKQVLTQLALKAQSNARATLQTLVEAKSPKQIAFVKQTNVAQTQQVNNGSIPPPAPARARKTKTTPNKLIAEDKNGSKTLDRRAATRAGKTNQGDTAVAVVLRSEN